MSAVGPVDVVRVVVSDSLVYHVDVLFPIVRNVENLKGMFYYMLIVKQDI